MPEGEEIYEIPELPKKWKAHRVILGKRREITVKVIELLLKSGANIHAAGDYALRRASENGHKEVVELLLKFGADIHAVGDYALRRASRSGAKKTFKLFI